VKVDIYMPIFIGDYLRDTTDLTTEEHGAYFLILMSMWTSGGSLPERKLGAVARVPADRWPGVWETLSRFFEVSDGRVTQGRLAEELSNAAAKREQARENGLRGGRPTTQSKPDGKPDNNQPVNQPVNPTVNPGHNPQKTSSPSPSPSESDPRSTTIGSRGRLESVPAGALWTPSDWHQAFGSAWCKRFGKLTYGHNGDSKGKANLAAALELVPDQERIEAQARAPQMFAEYLAMDGKDIKETRWCFAFFVQRWNGLRIPIEVPSPPRDTSRLLSPMPAHDPDARKKARAAREASEALLAQSAAAKTATTGET